MSHQIKRTTALGLNIVFRSQRVFTITYYCESCPNEFTDEMLTVSHSYCPCCDAKCEPGTIEESEEERPEFDLEDEEAELGQGPSLYTREEMARIKGIKLEEAE